MLRYQHGHLNDPAVYLTNIYKDPVLGSGAPNFVPTNLYTTDPDFYSPGTNTCFFRANNDVLQMRLNADLGFADLTFYTQYRRENSDVSGDYDGTAATVFQIGIPVRNKPITQEVILNSKAGSPLQYTAGLFFFKNTDIYQTFADNAVPSGPRVKSGGSGTDTYSYAGYIDGTYAFMPKLFLTAGGRYSHDQVKNAYYSVVTTDVPVHSIKADRVTPRVVLRYKPTDKSSVYASYTKGYKAAILDVGGSCQIAPAFQRTNVRPESLKSFQVGYKYADRGISFDASAFYYDYKNLQVSLFVGRGQASSRPPIQKSTALRAHSATACPTPSASAQEQPTPTPAIRSSTMPHFMGDARM